MTSTALRRVRPGVRSFVLRALPAGLRGTDAGLLAMALLAGAATGAGAIGFRLLIQALTWVFTGTGDYAAAEALAERLGDDGATGDVTRWAEVRPPVAPDATVADALELLERHSVRALPVVEADRLVGWFTPTAVLDRIRRHDLAG